MRLAPESRAQFAAQIYAAKKRGMTHFAKAVGSSSMKFATSEAEARRLAENAVKRSMRSAKIDGPMPNIQSGEL